MIKYQPIEDQIQISKLWFSFGTGTGYAASSFFVPVYNLLYRVDYYSINGAHVAETM